MLPRLQQPASRTRRIVIKKSQNAMCAFSRAGCGLRNTQQRLRIARNKCQDRQSVAKE